MIGDQTTDMEFAKRARIKDIYLNMITYINL